MDLYVISTWYNTRDSSYSRTDVERVGNADEARSRAQAYRDSCESSATKVDQIILIEGRRL
jgi:hypothetical protein